jgi:hypothetical protein
MELIASVMRSRDRQYIGEVTENAKQIDCAHIRIVLAGDKVAQDHGRVLANFILRTDAARDVLEISWR